MPNRLATETSPYLLQHANNPVDWYPWGPEALERAEREQRPILLSVGYSSCHWCHVMERESFGDPAIAALMNERYVNIKVDREERPDIDQIYLKAVQAMTGRGGWPMTVFLTPDRIPFFGGTYYPPEPRPGIPSFPQLLEAVHDAWQNRPDEVASGSARLLEALRATTTAGEAGATGPEELRRAALALQNQFDATWGGFGRAPKFPQPVTLDFLLSEHLRTGAPIPLEMSVFTLRRMAAGGVRDHLGGGFHRYSVDTRWLVPHFEKMLYDNALLARAYTDAWRITDSDDLREIAESTLAYLADDMLDPDGRFYSARDADSEGEEGTYYVWTPHEVSDVLGEEEGAFFSRVYDITEAGNFEGKSIPHLPHAVADLATAEGLPLSETERRLSDARRALQERRSSRPEPFRDEKALTSWNGLAIRAFAEAGAAFGHSGLVDIARRCGDRIWELHRAQGRLLHTSLGTRAKHHAFLDDHAALGNAFVSLHEATLDPEWLDRAVWLRDEILDRFWDREAETVFDTAEDAEALILRPRDPMDNATPSGSSLTAELLARLAALTDDREAHALARRIIEREAEALARYPQAFGRLLRVHSRLETPSLEIVVSAPTAEEAGPFLAAAHRIPHPSLVITGSIGESGPSIPLLEGRERVAHATAWVCSAGACRLPVEEPSAIAREVAGLR